MKKPILNYMLYQNSGNDPFFGPWTQYVLVLCDKCLAHFWTFANPEVETVGWDPLTAEIVGKKWSSSRPKGFRKVQPTRSYSEEKAMYWAVSVYEHLKED
jgi:hypothetical protein